LFFKTAFCDDEVDNGALGGNFRSEMGVEHFGHQVELKVKVVVNGVGSHFQDVVFALFFNGLVKQRVKGGVDFLLNSFHHHKFSVLNSFYKSIHPFVLISV